MDTGFVLPVAVVTGDGGALLVEVDEVSPGVLVVRSTGVEVDPLDLVVVVGLPDLVEV